MATSPPHMTQRPSSVVVVPNGSSLGCLRKDVVSDLVFEVWIMVSQGLPHHHPQEGGVGARARGPKIKKMSNRDDSSSWCMGIYDCDEFTSFFMHRSLTCKNVVNGAAK